MWKGDRVAASVAAASVVAKVTRDRIMVALGGEYPAYDFTTHKGYITDHHTAALAEHGPSPVHRMCFVNVRRAAGLEPRPGPSSAERSDDGAHAAGEADRVALARRHAG